MARHNKEANPREKTREIVRLKDLREEQPETEEEQEEREEEEEAKKVKIPKAVYRVAVILLVLILGLAFWVNRESLTPEKVGGWIRTQVMGEDNGEGFPIQITGSSVLGSNFLSQNGSAVLLSDTALTILSATGSEELSLRHSFNQPVLCAASGRYLLYNGGSTGYTVLSGTKEVLSSAQDREIRAGAISPNGKFALGICGSDGASELNVYQENGVLQYHYLFAKDYITAVALNADGSHGLVCTVGSDKGEMVSRVTVLSFDQETPLAEYETRDNLLLGASWTDRGTLYAVGDSALLEASSGDYAFEEHSYNGRQLTSFRLDGERAFLSVSAYEHAGPSTLLVYRAGEEPLKAEQAYRIECISVYGGTAALLLNGQAVFLDYSTGVELGRTDAGADAKSLALGSESAAYVLGVSEVRRVEIK